MNTRIISRYLQLLRKSHNIGNCGCSSVREKKRYYYGNVAAIIGCCKKGRDEERECGNLDIDFEKRIVRKNGEMLELTPMESFAISAIIFLKRTRSLSQYSIGG